MYSFASTFEQMARFAEQELLDPPLDKTQRRQKTLGISSDEIIRTLRLPQTPGRWQIVLYVINKLKQQISEGKIKNTYPELLSALVTLELPENSLYLLPETVQQPIDTPSQSTLDLDNWLYMAHTLYREQSRFPIVLSQYPRVSTQEMMRSLYFFSRLFSDEQLSEDDFKPTLPASTDTHFLAMKKIDAAMYAALSDGLRHVHICSDPELEQFVREYKEWREISVMPNKDELWEYLMGLVFHLAAQPDIFPFSEFVDLLRDSDNTRVLQEVFRLADYWASAAVTPAHPAFFSNRTTDLGYSTTLLYKLGHVGFSTYFSPYSVSVPTEQKTGPKEVTVWKLSTPDAREAHRTQEIKGFGQSLLRWYAVALLSPSSHVVRPHNSQTEQTFIGNVGKDDPLTNPDYRVTMRSYDWTVGAEERIELTAMTPDQARQFRSILVPLGYCVHALHAFRFNQKEFYQNVWQPIAGF